MLKKVLSSIAVASLFSTPAFADNGSYNPPKQTPNVSNIAQGFGGGATPPALSFASVATPYGNFACMQRAQNKMYQIGATGINNGSGSATALYGYYGGATIGVWCRGGEALIVVAGQNASALRDEMRSSF